MSWSFVYRGIGYSGSGAKVHSVPIFYSNSRYYTTNHNNCDVYILFDEANNNAYNTSSSYVSYPNDINLQPISSSNSYIKRSDNLYWSLGVTSSTDRQSGYPGGGVSGDLDLVFALVIERSTSYCYLVYWPWYGTPGVYNYTNCNVIISSSYCSSRSTYNTPDKITTLHNVFNRIKSSTTTITSLGILSKLQASINTIRQSEPVYQALTNLLNLTIPNNGTNETVAKQTKNSATTYWNTIKSIKDSSWEHYNTAKNKYDEIINGYNIVVSRDTRLLDIADKSEINDARNALLFNYMDNYSTGINNYNVIKNILLNRLKSSN